MIWKKIFGMILLLQKNRSPLEFQVHHQSPPKTLRFLIAPIPAISTHYKNLVGGLNLSQKYESNWIISLGRGKNKTCLKPPPRI